MVQFISKVAIMKEVMELKKGIHLLIVWTLLLCGCQDQYQLYTQTFTGPFDTVTQYISYALSQSEFDEQCALIEERLEYYDQLFDKYTSYDTINNVKTINDQAGKSAVKVDQPLIDLLKLSIERYQTISQKVNIAFGSVIDIWHAYREAAQDGVGEVPSDEELEAASEHTDINDIVIDEQQQTVYIQDPELSIDVGATAKGYAIELIKQELIESGVDNFLLSGGGNVVSYGKRKIKKDGNFYLEACQDHFCVGIESPQDGNYADCEDENAAILIVTGETVVTSGDYQRYYEDINGVRYHHLIDPDTLYPAIYFRSVSIVCEDSGLADFLSSAVFLMPYEDGLELIESLDEVEAIWLLEDGKIRMSSGLNDNDQIYIVEKDRLE